MPRRIRTVLVVALYLGCTGCPGGDDTEPPDGSTTSSARLTVDLDAELDTTEEGVTLTRAEIGVVELRARNDRGGDLEPRLEALGTLDLTAEPSIDLGGVTPATYGRATLRLEAGDSGDAFVLGFAHPDGTVEVAERDAITIDVRCEIPVSLGPGELGQLHLELEVEHVWAALGATALPSGAVRIDEESDPERLAAATDAFAAAWRLTCEDGDELAGDD